jgi:hypothetical protein
MPLICFGSTAQNYHTRRKFLSYNAISCRTSRTQTKMKVMMFVNRNIAWHARMTCGLSETSLHSSNIRSYSACFGDCGDVPEDSLLKVLHRSVPLCSSQAFPAPSTVETDGTGSIAGMLSQIAYIIQLIPSDLSCVGVVNRWID